MSEISSSESIYNPHRNIAAWRLNTALVTHFYIDIPLFVHANAFWLFSKCSNPLCPPRIRNEKWHRHIERRFVCCSRTALYNLQQITTRNRHSAVCLIVRLGYDIRLV